MVPKTRAGWKIGIDTGGTFTDLEAVSPDGEVRLVKVSSTPANPAQAAFDALERTDLELDADLDSFILGTTIATNATIQRRGPTTLFLTTAGFEDVLYIQRIDRRGLYDLQWVKPTPYVERRHCIGVHERVLHDGSIHIPLDDEEIDRTVTRVGKVLEETRGEAAIAISLLFSYVDSSHELLLAARLREAFPEVPVSVSSEVAPIWREYERSNTTVMDAYVKPIVKGFESVLAGGLKSQGMDCWKALMKSNGGRVEIGKAVDRPIDIMLSGLASGMIAGAHFARAVGSTRAVTLDMGGTSADIGVVVDGNLRFSGVYEVEWGLPIAMPFIDVVTIGAGGGSIAAIDSGGLLTVGPESAGADPGPACYGWGGQEPTVTDANLVTGRLNPDFFLGGELKLHRDRAITATEKLCGSLGLQVEDVAEAVMSVAVENMAGRIRLMTVDRGFDYREFDLVAFGGAGPLHAAEIVRRMGMRRVIVPPNPGLASAFGAVIADDRVDRRITLVRRLDLPEAADVPNELARVAGEAVKELVTHRRSGGDGDPVVSTYVACRYLGQNYEQEINTEVGHVDKSFELAIEIAPDSESFIEALAQAFHDAHRDAYGYDMVDQPIQAVYLGATARIPADHVAPQPYDGAGKEAPPTERRPVLVSQGRWEDTLVLRREHLRPGYRCEGPVIIEEADSTCYVPPGFAAEVHETVCLILSRSE